ncbi:MAG: translation elongation factor Ts [bacterium]|nr:translation elongation factor Ts [bacterium]
MFTAADVAKLREETGAGIMDAKKALTQSNGDYVKAIEVLKAQGQIKADKKGARETGAGYLETYIHGGRVGVLLEVRAETDFVTRSEPFREFAKNLTLQIAAAAPETVEDMLKQNYIKDETMTIENLLKATIAKVGENIRVVRFARYTV